MLTIYVITNGVVKVFYFSQLIICDEFISRLSSFESGFISSIRDSGLHASMLLVSKNAARILFRTLSSMQDGVFCENS